MEPGDFTYSCPAPVGAILVGDYAAYWLETLPSLLKPKTVRSYRELYRLHLAPSLKGIGLSELRRAQVKALLLDKQRQGLSRNNVRLIWHWPNGFSSGPWTSRTNDGSTLTIGCEGASSPVFVLLFLQVFLVIDWNPAFSRYTGSKSDATGTLIPL